MRKYTLIPHTSDVRLAVEGDSLEELFRAALEGMARILKRGFGPRRFQANIEDSVELTAHDASALLVDFLSNVLAYSHINGAVYAAVKFSELSGTKLRADVFGKTTPHFTKDIKAVTYHGAELTNVGKTWRAELTLDI